LKCHAILLEELEPSRGTGFGGRSREEGFDERTIADTLGQKTDSMARHYSRDADLSRKMTAVAERLEEAENERRTKLVKPPPKTVKP
jgi:hypothetical protein